MVYLLAATMIVITALVYKLGNQKIISPAMLFMLPFSLSALWLTLNISRWNVSLNVNTYLVIVCGSLSFLAGTAVVSKGIKGKSLRVLDIPGKRTWLFDTRISPYFFAVIFGLEVLILGLSFLKIRSIAHRYGYYGSISYEIYRFRNLGMYTTESTSLGRELDWLYQFSLSGGYIWIYILAHRLVFKKKVDIMLVLCLLVSLATGLIRGGRQSAIQIFVAGGLYFLIFLFFRKRRSVLPWKTIVGLVLGVICFAVLFQALGTVLGRTVRADFMQYIAVYLSGGIHNLNEWLKETHALPDVFGKMTFANIYPYLGRKLNRPDWVYVLDLPYITANGRNAGNIYTTFYAYIYDFGYKGVFILPFIMGALSQLVFKQVERAKVFSEFNVNLWVLLYGYIAYLLAFSFFSNKFYEGIVKQSFIKYLIIWWVMSYVINRMHRSSEYVLKIMSE